MATGDRNIHLQYVINLIVQVRRENASYNTYSAITIPFFQRKGLK